MGKVDARKQTRDVLHQRRQGVVRHWKAGMPVMKIVTSTGLSWSAVNAAIKLYKRDGASALKPQARGRKQGTGRNLTEAQETEVIQIIHRKRPYFYGLKDSLWSRNSVEQLIKKKYGIELSDRGIGGYLKRWGFTLPNPTKRPYQRCSKEVREWLDEHYSRIAKQAKLKNAKIYWTNKPTKINPMAALCSNSPNEKVPNTIGSVGSQQKLSFVSVVTNQGKVYWALLMGNYSSARRSKFREALRKDAKRDVILIPDDFPEASSGAPVIAQVDE